MSQPSLGRPAASTVVTGRTSCTRCACSRNLGYPRFASVAQLMRYTPEAPASRWVGTDVRLGSSSVAGSLGRDTSVTTKCVSVYSCECGSFMHTCSVMLVPCFSRDDGTPLGYLRVVPAGLLAAEVEARRAAAVVA